MASPYRQPIWLMLAVAICLTNRAATAQITPPSQPAILEPTSPSFATCETLRTSPLQETFRSICLRPNPTNTKPPAQNLIIIGFLGGFANQNDLKHPEVDFALLLQDEYPHNLHAETFANHQGKAALNRVMQLLDSDGDGVISAKEKDQANIIIYGHSWGASQAVTLARALGQQDVPVLLTVQIDSVRKPLQDDSMIPANVKKAVNFYQTRGFIHGGSAIHAADPQRTQIVGNFQMTYHHYPVNCDNYPWWPRHFNKPHHQIENDPRVWNQIVSLVESDLSRPTPTVQAAVPAQPMP
ncbi:MAG TPA: hypothetical protein VF753_14820 [Terriglobales bacterium]